MKILGDKKRSTWAWMVNHAKDLLIVAAAVGLFSGAMSHFASAADVEKKFKTLEVSFKISNNESRKKYIEDQLFRLRAEGANTPSNRAQIARFEAELREVTAKILDLERQR